MTDDTISFIMWLGIIVAVSLAVVLIFRFIVKL